MTDGPLSSDTTGRLTRAGIVDDLLALLQDGRLDETLKRLYAESSHDQHEIQEDLILALCTTERAPLARRFIKSHTDDWRACQGWICFFCIMKLADDEDLTALGARIGGIKDPALRLIFLDQVRDFLGDNLRRFDLVYQALTRPEDRDAAVDIACAMLAAAKS